MSDHYVRGPSRARKAYARLETKQGYDSGAGYERWRSWEVRDDTVRDGPEDAFVPHHRLLAVVACYPEDMPIGEILEDLGGKDVHHCSGVEFDNRPDNLAVREHGSHSSITNTQIRAWAEDDKRTAKAVENGELDEDRCDRCGESADVLGTSAAFPGEERCLSCARETAGSETVEL